jgi:hypothetical protein
MTLQWYDIDIDEPEPAEAQLVIASATFPLVSAAPSIIVCRGELPRGIALPLPVRVIISHAEKTFAFQLTAVQFLPEPQAGLSSLAVEAHDPTVWSVAAADFTAGIEPTLEDITAAARTTGSDPVGVSPRAAAARTVARQPSRATLGLIGLALLFGAVVVTELYGRFYVATANASFVSIDLVPVQSPGSGRIIFLAEKPRLAAGEPLLGINQRSGNDVSLESPCACDVFARLAVPGAVVRRGDRILYLARPDAQPFIVANVDRTLLFRFGSGVHVRLAYSDGVIIDREMAPVRLIDPPASPAEDDQTVAPVDAPVIDPNAVETVNLRLDPGRTLDRSMIGAPVAVTFDLFNGSTIARLIAATGLWEPRGGANASS